MIPKVILFVAILAAKSYSCDNSTVWDDLTVNNYNGTVEVIKATEYCQINNFTIMMIQTGYILKVLHYNNSYYISNGLDDQPFTLIEFDKNYNYCKHETTAINTYQVFYIFSCLLISILNLILVLLIIHKRLYSTLPIMLLLAALVAWIVAWITFLIYGLTEFIIPANNTFCISIVAFAFVWGHCAKFIELEMCVTIGYVFYKCIKSINNEKLITHKCRKFWMLIALAAALSLLFNTIRIVIIVLQESDFSTKDGFCISQKLLHKINPMAHNLQRTCFGFMICIIIIALMITMVLLGILAKYNTVKLKATNIRLVKIAIIMLSLTGLSILVYHVIFLSKSKEYGFYISVCLVACEKCCLMFIFSCAKTGQ